MSPRIRPFLAFLISLSSPIFSHVLAWFFFYANPVGHLFEWNVIDMSSLALAFRIEDIFFAIISGGVLGTLVGITVGRVGYGLLALLWATSFAASFFLAVLALGGMPQPTDGLLMQGLIHPLLWLSEVFFVLGLLYGSKRLARANNPVSDH